MEYRTKEQIYPVKRQFLQRQLMPFMIIYLDSYLPLLTVAIPGKTKMEKSTHKRTPVRLEAILISGMERYIAFVGNVSRQGLYAMIALPETELNFIPPADFAFIVHLSQEKTLTLHCNKKWAYQLSPDSLTVRIGMEIVDPPDEYREFLKTLN